MFEAKRIRIVSPSPPRCTAFTPPALVDILRQNVLSLAPIYLIRAAAKRCYYYFHVGKKLSSLVQDPGPRSSTFSVSNRALLSHTKLAYARGLVERLQLIAGSNVNAARSVVTAHYRSLTLLIGIQNRSYEIEYSRLVSLRDASSWYLLFDHTYFVWCLV